MTRTHLEPYLYLAHVTEDSALIAWGGFEFTLHDEQGDWELVDDERLVGRKETIGERSEPYGEARVCVYDEQGELVSEATTHEQNHVLVTGLAPNRRYRYAVFVNGQAWAQGERNDWCLDRATGREHLRPNGRSYDNTFWTHPAADEPAELAFVLLGDYGVGIRGNSESARRQREVAAALERAVDQHGARLLLTAGDNIYLPKISSDQGSGDEDDDWFFTFYQPYRYVINRVPVYPTVGNHDGAEREQSDDREQLEDNFFLSARFASEQGARSGSDPGLLYHFRFGRDIELVSIDTSMDMDEGCRHFEHPSHRAFLERVFAPEGKRPQGARWLIPFTHHPPYCAGPRHGNDPAMLSQVVPLLRAAGVRVMFSGHEHNFQYSEADGVHYFISGAGAKLRPEPPQDLQAAHTRAWCAQGHFLLIQIRGKEMLVTPIARLNGDELELVHLNSIGDEVTLPVVIRLD